MPMDKIMAQQSAVSDQQSELQILNDSGFFWRERDGIKILVCRALEDAGFINGFSTRLGGVSILSEPPASAGGQFAGDLNLAGFDDDAANNIAENRRRFLNALGEDMRLAVVWQVHGDTIKSVECQADIERSEDRADAIVSNLDGVLAGVKTADCVPVLLGDPATGAFAAVHAGWRGTVRSIVGKAVQKLVENYDFDPGDLICAIGPAASCRSYEIGHDVMDEFADKLGAESMKYFQPTRDHHALVDLHAANRDQLIACGVKTANIFTAPFCTMERPDLFFSYRLEKKKYGRTGRLLSVIGRAPSG